MKQRYSLVRPEPTGTETGDGGYQGVYSWVNVHLGKLEQPQN